MGAGIGEAVLGAFLEGMAIELIDWCCGLNIEDSDCDAVGERRGRVA